MRCGVIDFINAVKNCLEERGKTIDYLLMQ